MVRERSLEGLAFLTPADTTLTGTHPEFGTVTLSQALSAWVAHDLTHLAQIGEVAGRYREEVGPYRRYMPALDRFAPPSSPALRALRGATAPGEAQPLGLPGAVIHRWTYSYSHQTLKPL
ncbi:hypothetical protein GCM10010532_112820 [Dactylosporangium siamense]|uniref:DinB-like domain-containing protein n=1 Tax=Dactylosporangium siamense TaxID=685454 RepID=A0A919UJ27_9ACTN|nr:hypothetical protein Dsi01nite_102840 [Dactylosporangium siamense]